MAWLDALLAVVGGLVAVGWVLTGRSLLALRNMLAEATERLARLEAGRDRDD